VDSFAAVLGTRRGSALAQAQRDADENMQLEVALADKFVSVQLEAGSAVSFEMLVRAYRLRPQQQPQQREIADAQLIEELLLLIEARSSVRELAVVCAHGDPRGWPGLTAPAAAALTRYFADVHAARSLYSQKSAGRTIGRTVADRAEAVLNTCLATREDCDYDVAYYQRLQPLSDILATLIVSQSGAPYTRRLRVRAAAILWTLPAEVLVGPMASWVSAFAQAFDAGLLTSECDILADGFLRRAAEADFLLAVDALVQRLRVLKIPSQ
jgi:hypothetical protein